MYRSTAPYPRNCNEDLYDSQPDNLTAQVLHSRSYNSRDQKTGPYTNFITVQPAYILNKAMIE